MEAAPVSVTLPINGSKPVDAKPFQRPYPDRDHHVEKTLGRDLNRKVKESRVLVVGAGGIGCELLKALVLSGFGEIHLVDLDTIDLSNLNRQFLFRHEHIKKSKALVAREAAQRFNPNVKLVAYHSDIKTFPVSFYRQFDLVFNALDNLDARRHVNRMCVASDRILIESGTTGFNGQVQVIKRGVTACYDCTPKEVPKSFPVCTIRSTPSQPIHCIVWAKSYLLNEIFGESEDESAFDHSDDAQNATEIAELRKEAQALKDIRQSLQKDNFMQMLFDKVFDSDIERLRSMEDMWKTREKPEAIKYSDVWQRVTADGKELKPEYSADVLARGGQKVWSLEENFAMLRDSINRLVERSTASPGVVIEFDKDDIDTLDFVTSAANIRAAIFNIDRKSRFDIKQMAGNIIPAIATTNAIVASLCVLEAFKIFSDGVQATPEVFLMPSAIDRMLSSDKSRPPNPDCPVCNPFYATATADFSKLTIRDLVEDLAIKHLGFNEDSEIALSSDGNLLYDVEETDSLDKKLSDLGIKTSAWMKFIDESDDAENVDIHIWVEAAQGPELEALSGKSYAIASYCNTNPDGTANIPKKPTPAPAPAPAATKASNGAAITVDDEDRKSVV